MRKSLWIILGVIVIAISAPSAMADGIGSTLDTGNSAISGVPGPYGFEDVNLTSSTTATITFTNNGSSLFGDSGAVAVNVNAASWTISKLLGAVSSGFSGPLLMNTGSGNVDGFGLFNQTFEEFDGFTWALVNVTFQVTNTSDVGKRCECINPKQRWVRRRSAHFCVR